MALRNQLSELEENPFGQPEFQRKYEALVQETNAYREQNQALNAEILNLRGLFSASVDHERKLIDAVKRLHEIYSMVRSQQSHTARTQFTLPTEIKYPP